jgi:hypothetical protein
VAAVVCRAVHRDGAAGVREAVPATRHVRGGAAGVPPLCIIHCAVVYYTLCRCCHAAVCVSRASAAERQQRKRPGILWPAAQRSGGAGGRGRQNSRYGEMDGVAGDVRIKLRLLRQFVRSVRVLTLTSLFLPGLGCVYGLALQRQHQRRHITRASAFPGPGVNQSCSLTPSNLHLLRVLPTSHCALCAPYPYPNLTPNPYPYLNLTPNPYPYPNLTPNPYPYPNLTLNRFYPYRNLTPNRQLLAASPEALACAEVLPAVAQVSPMLLPETIQVVMTLRFAGNSGACCARAASRRNRHYGQRQQVRRQPTSSQLYSSADLFPRNSVIASIRDGVFPSPRSAAALPLDHRAAEPEKGTPAKAPLSNKIAEDSPPISETSFSSDSVSYYLKLRQQDPPDEQQHLSPPVARNMEPPRRMGQLHDSIDVTKLRQFHQQQQAGSDYQQLQLRQVMNS